MGQFGNLGLAHDALKPGGKVLRASGRDPFAGHSGESISQARVKRRPAVGEASSSSRTLSDSPFSAASCSIRAIFSGVRSPAFSASILASQAAPSRDSFSSNSTVPRSSDLSISSKSASTSFVLGHLAQRLAVGVDQALVLGAGDAEVRVRGLADPVHRAAEHGHLDRLDVAFQPLLDLGDDRVHVELQAAAGRAGDQHRAALAQLQRLEDLPGDLDLLLGVEGREADPDRVADPVGEQRAEADRRLERARPLGAGLGDAEVQRVGDLLREQAVGGDRVGHVGRLDRDLEVLEIQRLHQLDELDRGGDQRLDRALALERVQVLGQRAGVDPDPHRHVRPRSLAPRPRRPCRGRRCCPG